MGRRKAVGVVREVGPDPRFGSEAVQKLINTLMRRGKKSVAQHIVYEALDMAVKKAGSEKNALDLYNKALEEVTPTVEVRPRRVGGSVYQVPREVRPRRKQSLALRWLVDGAKKRSEKTMGQRLGREILAASEGQGVAVKKKQDVHKMADSNRAFSHFSW